MCGAGGGRAGGRLRWSLAGRRLRACAPHVRWLTCLCCLPLPPNPADPAEQAGEPQLLGGTALHRMQ